MNPKRIRFTAGSVIVLAAIAYFAVSGFQEGKAYYKTIDELDPTADAGKRLRVAGIVSTGTIERDGTQVSFQLEQEDLRLPVIYTGSAPIPDTFKDGVEAVVEGYRHDDGTFEADHIQAKCASKYEAEYGEGEAPHDT